MADDKDDPGPARPGSRGPRVVTGDMKRPGTQARRVVTGPGVAAPPPAPEKEPEESEVDEPDVGTATAETMVTPRRPRVVTGPSVRAPEDEDEVEPEPWEAIQVSRTPPPLHRSAPSAVPTETKRGKAPKPPKAGKPPTGPTSGKGRRPLRILAGLVLLAVLVVAGILIADAAKPDGVDYAELRAGDCIDTPEGTEVRRLKVRACDEAHDAEVFAVIQHPAAPTDPFPGATALLEYAANTCLGQPFTDYVGIPRGQSTLTEFEIVPESEAWDEGRRGLVCAVDNADRSPLTASVRGAAR